MISEYYNLPLKLGDIIQKKEHSKCSLYESVARMIHLISITHFGECKHDETFGCEIWENDFEIITNSQLFKDQLKTSLLKTIKNHEPRLTMVSVNIQMEQVEYRMNNRRTKTRIELKVNGTLTKTNEPFSHLEHFFIGPLSYY